ncbi:hypothetical protein BDV95DRAFT_239293 [Massariosphaeria phaeospora]|uniref:Uncharacterized protein n=1 Tax=Massariosphaeria phaeospora TaxID=100035 RepID=A0A7C8MI12_9PLEO|nr:hypothetical protein BDV95DRAFT_239293 [Massariosphaeria phaeospora]
MDNFALLISSELDECYDSPTLPIQSTTSDLSYANLETWPCFFLANTHGPLLMANTSTKRFPGRCLMAHGGAMIRRLVANELHPYTFRCIKSQFRQIHHHFKHGYDENARALSREVEQLSQDLQWLSKRRRDLWELAKLSEELKIMATGLQVGPRRLLYYTMPKVYN